MVVDSLRLGGAENVLVTLARAAPAAGFTIEVACLAPAAGATASMVPVLAAAGVPTRFLDVPRLLHLRAVPAVRAAVHASGCDVVHAHLEYAATLAAPAAVGTGRSVFSSFHQLAGPLPAREAVKERLAVTAAGRGRGVVFVSAASLESYARRYRRRRNWQVVPNGVDLAQFAPGDGPLPDDLDLPPGVPVVTIVAALRPGKGHALAIAAWPRVLRRTPEARLLVVGSGALEPPLRRQVAELRLERRVIFTGMRTDVPQILRGTSVVLLPSMSEALPTTLIEAAAAGRPVVATSVGGVPEIVVDHETGVLVPAGDGDALTEAVSGLLTDGPTRAALGANARLRAERLFGMRLWAERLRALYDAA